MSEPSNIQKERVGAVMRVGLYRAEKLNALTRQMYLDLTAALKEADADDEISVVVLHGSGGVFTSGNDLFDFMSLATTDEAADLVANPGFQFLYALAGFSKPLILEVEGTAVGIGTTILLHADLVYAADSARFQLPFVQLGLVPEAGSSLLLPLLVGHARASELLLLGDAFGAERAQQLGLVNEVLPADQLTARVMARAQQVAAAPSGAVQQTKGLLKASVQQQLEETIGREGALFIQHLRSAEAQAAFMAFFARKSQAKQG